MGLIDKLTVDVADGEPRCESEVATLAFWAIAKLDEIQPGIDVAIQAAGLKVAFGRVQAEGTPLDARPIAERDARDAPVFTSANEEICEGSLGVDDASSVAAGPGRSVKAKPAKDNLRPGDPFGASSIGAQRRNCIRGSCAVPNSHRSRADGSHGPSW